MTESRWKSWLAVALAAGTMLASVALVSTGGWLISSAALLPPILTLQVAIVGVRFFGVARGVLRWSERVVSHDVALTGTTANRVRLWEAAAWLGPRGVWRLRGSDALDRLTSDTDLLQDNVTRVRTPFIAAACSAAVLVCFEFYFLPFAGLALLTAMFIGGVLLPLVTLRVETQVATAALDVRNRISATISDLVNRGSEFRVLGLGDYVASTLAAQDAERVRIESRSSRWAARTGMASGVATGLAVFSSLAIAVEAHRQGALNGVMIAVVTLLPWSAGEITASFSQAVSARTRVAAAAARVDSLLSAAAAVQAAAPSSRDEILASPSVLEADRISVSWDDRPVAVDISLSVRRGERLAIVGPTGCGKSSVASALLRLVEHEGMVTLDSVPVDRLADFRSHVTALLQVTHVFNTSLAENLRLANPFASDEDLLRALRQAGLWEWFGTLPAGLDTVLGASGRGMSGGEVQRLGIARVLLSEAAFVILDEPTEHLDAETAAKVWQTMNRAFTDRGLIIISHDPEVALDCDQVMVMADGHIAEYGAPDDLNPEGWFHRSAATDF